MALRTKRVVTIPYLTGLDESYGAVNGDVSTAPFAYNVLTDYGQFTSAKGFEKFIDAPLPSGVTSAYLFADRIGGEEHQHVVIGLKGELLFWNGNQWASLYSGGSSGDWGFVTYQSGEDVLMIAGNGVDPLLYWDGSAQSALPIEGAPGTGNMFCVHFERVFFAGDPQHPDRVYYSRPFDPFNWAGDVDLPENGGGFVDIPTWDGGVITALISAESDIVVGKSTAMFRLYGTTPQDFTIVPVTGSMGVSARGSHALSGSSHYYITEFGVATYYGGHFSLLDDRKLPRIFEPSYQPQDDEDVHLAPGYDNMAAGVADGQQRVLFALALGPVAMENNAVLEYDITRQTFLLRRGFNVIAWMKAGFARSQILFVGRHGENCYVYAYESGDTMDGEPQKCRWETPWLDLSAKYARKRISSIRLYGGTKDMGAVRLMIQTNKCQRERVIVPALLKSGSVRFSTNCPGERFRFVMENIDGSVFSFTGGLELEVELDE